MTVVIDRDGNRWIHTTIQIPEPIYEVIKRQNRSIKATVLKSLVTEFDIDLPESYMRVLKHG